MVDADGVKNAYAGQMRDSGLYFDRGSRLYRNMSLLYTVFFFIDPFNKNQMWDWIWLAAVLAILVVLFIGVPYTRGWFRILLFVLFFGMGFAYLPFNSSFGGYFVYPTVTLAFVLCDMRKMIAIMLAECALIALEGWLLHGSVWPYGLAIFLVLAITFPLLYSAQERRASARLQLAQNEIENLAKVAERERIARDLHDLLGHTLTLVVLKSELVERLIESDPASAKHEVMEIQQTARKALTEVREAVSGYRSQGLPVEIKRAEHTLQVAGIAMEYTDVDASVQDDVLPEQESVLTLALREAMTNVVRHSQATKCVVRLVREDRRVVLTVQDNGVGLGSRGAGFGLRGMQERVEAAGGDLHIEGKNGTMLKVSLPVKTRGDEAGRESAVVEQVSIAVLRKSGASA